MQLQLVDGKYWAELTKDPEYNSYEVEEIEGHEGEVLTCVLEKILLAPQQLSPSQHHSIFKTWNTINDKVCELLIDSDDTETSFLLKLWRLLIYQQSSILNLTK